MDALPSAAAAIAIDREAAVAELARERATMANEDARSYLAQRHFVGSLQVPRDDTPMTWQAAYDFRHQHWLEAVAAMRAAARANRARDAAAVERALREQLGSDTEEEEEDLEEDEEAEEEVEEVRVISPPPAAFVPFSGNGHRLDDA